MLDLSAVRRGARSARSLAVPVLLMLLATACDLGGAAPADPPAAEDPPAAAQPGGDDAAGEAGGEPGDDDAGAAGAGDPAEGAAEDGDAPDGADAAGQRFKGVANSPCGELEQLGATWYYNWGIDGESCGGAEFVPMVWGGAGLTPDDVSAAVQRAADAGHATVLGFNEPDRPDQADMTVDQALALWPSMTADDGILVASPATSSAAEGQRWMEEFMTRATDEGLRVDVLAVHWYGWGAGSCDPDAAGLDQYLDWAESLPGDLPIWITEFGCLNESGPDAATVQAFYEGVVEMLEDHPRVERYAWFPWVEHHHLAEEGALTPLGDVFAAAPAQRS